MRAETLSRGLGEERNSRERPAGIPAGPAALRLPTKLEALAHQRRTWEQHFDFTDVMHGVARMLRDVEAMRYVVLSLVPEPDKVLAVRLIQKRYRMSARRARHLLGLPLHAEGTPLSR